MNIAILEASHFQYTITQAEIFSDYNILIITTESIKKSIIEYAPEMLEYQYKIIKSIAENENEILNLLNESHIDLFLISPVFDSYNALRRIVNKSSCKKVLTTHNINTWFHGRFWSPNSLKDKINMMGIINKCDYVAVEDFIYNHLKSTNDILFRKYNFLYIPFTIFTETKQRKYQKTDSQLKVVLTGAIDGERRRYEVVIGALEYFKERSKEITFSFAGRAKGSYGFIIQNQLRAFKSKYPAFVTFFENDSTTDMFRYEMETSDIVLSTSSETFKGMGTLEYIGKTKPTAAIHDMISYELPGLLPRHLNVPVNLSGSVFNYNSVEDLINILNELLDNSGLILQWKEQAKRNSLNFTAEIIRKGLPF